MILLTSFLKSNEFSGSKYSAAVYQPKGYTYPKAAWADIRKDDGTWIRPREFVSWNRPLNGYFASLFSLYLSRRDEIEEWVERHGSNLALLCWCPYEKAAQRQLREYGSYVCHLGVVEAILKEIGEQVRVDKDRKKMVRFY